MQREARQRLAGSDNREEYLKGLKECVDDAMKTLRSRARKMSTKRKKHATALADEVRSHLVDLGFKQAEFEVQLEVREEPGPYGLENVEYLFGPNPGEPLKPSPAGRFERGDFTSDVGGEKCAG